MFNQVIKFLLMKTIKLTTIFVLLFLSAFSQEGGLTQPKWIWYPGDFEVWLHTEVGGRRQERGQPYPPFWRVDSHYGVVSFEKTYNITNPEKIKIYADGRCQVRVDGRVIFAFDPLNFELPSGKHQLKLLVENFVNVPSVLVQGKTVFSDETWMVTNQNHILYHAASGNFTQPGFPPSTFHLEYTAIASKTIENKPNTLLVDFGKETFGKVIAEKASGSGLLRLYYGETKEEALAETQAETYDYRTINSSVPKNDTTAARAFRYIYAVWDTLVRFDKLSALYEYLPVTYKGNFSCSDTLLNRIYEVSLYTQHLNTREFHLDGIKRDRWVWSGDAYQSYLMNFYTFFDEDVNKRTFYALRGHDPVETHINTILDYSFYWMIGISDHYLYTGDSAFVRQIYPRMKTLMEFCLNRTNSNGFVEGLPGDWVFIDWANMEKDGEVSFEQILLARSLEAMALSAKLANDQPFAEKCLKLSKEIRQKIFGVFWSDRKNALLHNRTNGVLSETVTRYANLFAILFDYVDNEKKQKIKENVILNKDILKITTPYMKFYELAALCEIGEKQKAIEFVKDYWGGMLKLGATSIWETFDPEQKGNEHYAMYGRPFGKSLCHAWGANPVYLFGKYLLGVKPSAPGYQSYLIEPSLAGLEWIKGKVPTPRGNIEIYMDKKVIRIKTVNGDGRLKLKSEKPPKIQDGLTFIRTGEKQFEISLPFSEKEYTIHYW